MRAEFNPSEIEAKWQKRWEEAGVFAVDLKKARKPYYNLVMFPYPSGAKLHVGHWFQYSIPDSYARFKKMCGYDVFQPIGFDAFGLPAENYAIKTGVPPAESTADNVENMIAQFKRMGVANDWRSMVNTSTPEYYRWTQWLFLQMFAHGLAYKKEGNVNFCPSCQTVLANEQAQEGKCERCGSDVQQKALPQWYWKTTAYAQRLLDGLSDLDWPEKTKLMQRNWIDRSEGVNFSMKVKDMDIRFEVYDSIPQTFKAQTFVVIAPEHPMVLDLVKGTPQEKEVLAFVDKIKKKKAAKRFDFQEDVEGVFTGRSVENPFGMGDLPIWVASFVVMEYGTGIVSCSTHDERDFVFAKKYGIPLRPVMFPEDKQEAEKVRTLEYCYTKDPEGILQLPEEFSGRRWGEVREDMIEYIVQKGYGTRQINYRLRDWLISRQRYWGAPIPVVYDPEGKAHPIPEKYLPWILPTDVEFKPTGKSPLFYSKELRERTEKIFGKGWTPEFDTMDTFVCSSYYELMFLTGHQREEMTMTPDKSVLIDPLTERKWMPVSLYIGGPEHACMHLIYARFVMMALKDFGFVENSEPFKKLVHQGLITHKGAKMSKSRGNVVSPDDFVARHGSDVFRMYLMFMGPFTDGGDWSDTGIMGISRFVRRIYAFLSESVNKKVDQPAVVSALHCAIKKVTEDIEELHFNTAISTLMSLLNLFEETGGISKDTAHTFILLLTPLAPHLAEELWEMLGGSLSAKNPEGKQAFAIQQKWPTFNPAFTKASTVTIAIQVNGKLRGDITVPAGSSQEAVLTEAKKHPNVSKFLEGQKMKKEIYVPGKLVSLVV